MQYLSDLICALSNFCINFSNAATYIIWFSTVRKSTALSFVSFPFVQLCALFHRLALLAFEMSAHADSKPRLTSL